MRRLQYAALPATVLVALLAGAPGCAPPPPVAEDPVTLAEKSAGPPAAEAVDPPWFVEEAAAAGLDFVHRSGQRGDRYLIPESAAGGAALVDVDGDGLLDVYLIQSAEDGRAPAGNRLYRNLDGRRFADVTEASGAGDRGYGVGVAAGDVDGDGDADLYVTNVGPNVLLRNDGAGPDGVPRFTDVTAAAGVGDPGFGASAAFFDLEGDGDLDLYVVNYLVWSEASELACRNARGESDYCDPTEYEAPARDVLYRNDGVRDGTVRFTDVSRAAGLDAAFGNGLGVMPADFTGDGLLDVFVANDRMRDQLWVNLGDGRFADRALVAGCALDDSGKPKAGMGVAARDVDFDGDPDLLVVNFSDESDSFFRNEGAYFADATAAVGLGAASRPFTRFGVGLVDFDNDGLLDLYEATGRVARQSPRYGDDPYAEPDLLFRGVAALGATRFGGGFEEAAPGATRFDEATAGATRFLEVQPRGGTSTPIYAASRAAAFGDLDNDGGVDVVVASRDGAVRLLRNVVPARGRFLLLRLMNERGGDAVGATVALTVGERRIVRTVSTAGSYCAASDPRVHVGLGDEPAARDVEVVWPGGVRERFGDLAADAVVTLVRGRGTPP